MKNHVGITSVLRRYLVGAWSRPGNTLALALLVGVTGCHAPLDSGRSTQPSFRDQNAPIGATTRFEAARFDGLWYLRAYLPEAERFDQLRFDSAGPGFRIAAEVCQAAGACGLSAQDLKNNELGQGRYQVMMPDGSTRALWVLWVDEGFRTAALGDPAGTFAWILDRAPGGGADRIAAAREILDFNGYDISQLKVKQ